MRERERERERESEGVVGEEVGVVRGEVRRVAL